MLALGGGLTIFHLGGTLAQIRPLFGMVQEAMLVGPLRSPYDAGGGSRRVESSMSLVAFVGFAELGVDVRVLLCVPIVSAVAVSI